MSSHPLIKAALDAHAGLAALVGTRIRADLANETDDYPFVIFKRSGLELIRGIDESLHGRHETFDVECWAGTRSASVDVSEQAMLALAEADLAVEQVDPDGIDPQLLERVIVLRVEVFT